MISLDDTARPLTKDVSFVECDRAGQCSCLLLPMCGLRGPLKNAQIAFFKELDKTTLGDACGSKTKLHEVLHL